MQSLDNETDVMRSVVSCFLFRSDFFLGVGSRPERIGIHCNRQTCTALSLFRSTSCICKIINSNLGGGFLSRNRSGRESQCWLWLDKPGLPVKTCGSETRPKPDVNFEEHPVSHFAGKKKCTSLQMAAYGKHKMVCT